PDTKRNYEAALFAQLPTWGWVTNNENLLITGPAGVGKSNLSSALGHQACLNGFRVIYFNSQKLFYSLRLGKMDGTHRKQINAMAKADVLIIDDFGMQKLDDYSRLDLMEAMEDRHGRKATIIASQLPVSAWYEIIGEPTLSDAILDRLTSKTIRVDLKGESLRKNKKLYASFFALHVTLITQRGQLAGLGGQLHWNNQLMYQKVITWRPLLMLVVLF